LFAAVKSLAESGDAEVASAIVGLDAFPRDTVHEALSTAFADPTYSNNQRLAIACGLAAIGHVPREFLLEMIPTASASQVGNIAAAMSHNREACLADLRQAAAVATDKQDWLSKTRLATVALYLQDVSIAADMLRATPVVGGDGQATEGMTADWRDAPLDANWIEVAEPTKAAFAAAHGILADRFAYCLDMPWPEFLMVVETLRASGYRPRRVRPFVLHGQRHVAAVWARDGERWKLETDLTAESLPAPDANAEKDGLLAADVAAYLGEAGSVLYCMLWLPAEAEGEQRFLRVGLTLDEEYAEHKRMWFTGRHCMMVHAVVAPDGQRHYSCIWSTRDGKRTVSDTFTEVWIGFAEECWEDVSLAGEGFMRHPYDSLRIQLSHLEKLPDEQYRPQEIACRATIRYYLSNPQGVLDDLTLLMASPTVSLHLRVLQPLCLAQLGKAEEARQALEAVRNVAGRSDFGVRAQVLTLAWLGEASEALRILDEYTARPTITADELFRTAGTAAQFMRVFETGDLDRRESCRKRAKDLLRRAYMIGVSKLAKIKDDPDFAPLHDDRAFQELVLEFTEKPCYSGTWQTTDDWESQCDLSLPLEEHRAKAPARVSANYRPWAAAANMLGNQSAPIATIVWRRPKTRMASWKPDQRSLFIASFPTCCGPVEKLVEVLRRTGDASLRSGMCLAIGSLQEPSPEAKKVWRELWTQWHTSPSDGGTHSASGWALRNWDIPLPALTPPATVNGASDWQLTKTGLTMLRIRAGEISRLNDVFVLPVSKTISISEDFWLSECEITAGQYRTFLQDSAADKPALSSRILDLNYSRDERAPISSVNWYDAVLFCNWLSRQEGREPCYVKTGTEQIRSVFNEVKEHDVWQLVPDSSGYRLPTHDEWEYACRVTTASAFSFGDDETLLDQYGVFVRNSEGQPKQVGSKFCNPWGLFDMHGNVQEWCQDTGREKASRMALGGDFISETQSCRSSETYRMGMDADIRVVNFGFRVATGAVNK
jgi:formylglycine-generating enzyme required for sulfatase activity